MAGLRIAELLELTFDRLAVPGIALGAALEDRRRIARRGAPSLGTEALAKAAGPLDNDARYAARRQKLVAELEQIYGELDEEGAGPQGGGKGVAA